MILNTVVLIVYRQGVCPVSLRTMPLFVSERHRSSARGASILVVLCYIPQVNDNVRLSTLTQKVYVHVSLTTRRPCNSRLCSGCYSCCRRGRGRPKPPPLPACSCTVQSSVYAFFVSPGWLPTRISTINHIVSFRLALRCKQGDDDQQV